MKIAKLKITNYTYNFLADFLFVTTSVGFNCFGVYTYLFMDERGLISHSTINLSEPRASYRYHIFKTI